jgi:hypothetical protein
MDLEMNTTEAQQSDEFDIDLRLGAGDEPGESPAIFTSFCSRFCTNSSTCSHTSPRFCC